jgi:hypothetical protein
VTWGLEGGVATDQGVEAPRCIAGASHNCLRRVKDRQEDSWLSSVEQIPDPDPVHDADGWHPRTPSAFP